MNLEASIRQIVSQRIGEIGRRYFRSIPQEDSRVLSALHDNGILDDSFLDEAIKLALLGEPLRQQYELLLRKNSTGKGPWSLCQEVVVLGFREGRLTPKQMDAILPREHQDKYCKDYAPEKMIALFRTMLLNRPVVQSVSSTSSQEKSSGYCAGDCGCMD